MLLFAPVGFYGGQMRGRGWGVSPALLLLIMPVLVAWLIRTPMPATWEVAVGATAAWVGRALGQGLRT
jgi:hypothetical protein